MNICLFFIYIYIYIYIYCDIPEFENIAPAVVNALQHVILPVGPSIIYLVDVLVQNDILPPLVEAQSV